MPLPETMGPENKIDPERLKAMGQMLITCIEQAERRGHLTCGMKACAELLQKDPETVMLCLLPGDSSNVATSIHQMLIEAFCHEYFIPIFKTCEQQKVNELIVKLAAEQKKTKKAVIKGDEHDTSCLLLECPKLGPSKQDEALCLFHNEMVANPHPMAYLLLPD